MLCLYDQIVIVITHHKIYTVPGDSLIYYVTPFTMTTDSTDAGKENTISYAKRGILYTK